MNQTDQQWLVNRVHASVDDDYYLDRDEEKRIKEEGTARGISIKDIEMIIRTELDSSGSVSERVLLDELERLLHQFTDNDKELDRKEERNAFDKVLIPAPGKKKGLDPRLAEEYVVSFCKVNSIKRTTDSKGKLFSMIVAVIAVTAIIIVGNNFISKNKQTAIGKSPGPKNDQNAVGDSPNSKNNDMLVSRSGVTVKLNDSDRAEIDDLLRRAESYFEKAQYTDPPEKSAKACLDSIRQIDPVGQYRGQEAKALGINIVEHYLMLADKAFASGDKTGTVRWVERAKLLNEYAETIRDRERKYGLLKTEK